MSESSLETRLKQLSIYKTLNEKCIQNKTYEVLTLVEEVGKYSIYKLKTVIKNMPEFTLHDEEHIFNMLYIAGKIIPKSTLNDLSIPDLMMIILTIFLHDIGMAPEEKYIRAWKKQLSSEELDECLKEEYEEFYRFRMTYTQQLNEIDIFYQQKEYSKAQLLEDYIITEYIRVTHAERAKKIIVNDWAGKIKYKDTDLTAELATICFSHNEDYTCLLNMEQFKLCDMETFLCIPFVAVILRVTDIIDFDPKRTPSVLFSHLAVKNPISLAEWNKHQNINAWTITSKSLIFSAQCSHPAIEDTIHKFCDQIDNELRNSTVILSNLTNDDMDIDISKYKIPLPPKVERKKILAKKDIISGKPLYRYNDTKFTLSKKQVIDLLMGTKLYGKPEVALRELLQNSIDACLLRQKLSEKWGDNYTPHIYVSYKTKNGIDYLQVKDNGIGMNQHIIDNYYTNIGCSYYVSREFNELMAKIKSKFIPISRFGIGILSCFMVCDSLEVVTRRVIDKYDYDDALKVTIEGYDSLFIITDSLEKEPGTNTTLRLRSVNPWSKMTEEEFFSSVKNLIPNPAFQIDIVSDNKHEIYSSDNFENLDLLPIQDYSWEKEDNIEKLEIDLTNPQYGFKGKACIGCIVKSGLPVEQIDILSKDVVIDGEYYSLSLGICYGNNCIKKDSTNIEVNEYGEINTQSSYSQKFISKSSLSIHGIEVPCSLFSDYTNFGVKAVLTFPFPITFRLDIGDNNDLNLNSARTQIIYDDKWLKFEQDIFKVICMKLSEKMENKKWIAFKNIMLKNNKVDVFEKIINEF